MEVAEPWVDCLLEEYFMQVGSTGALWDMSSSRCSRIIPVACVSSERPGESRGTSCGAVHGQREGDQADGSDRLHQVRSHPHV